MRKIGEGDGGGGDVYDAYDDHDDDDDDDDNMDYEFPDDFDEDYDDDGDEEEEEDDDAIELSRCFVVDSYNVHRLIIAGITCASKFFSDVFYTNGRYAKVCLLCLTSLSYYPCAEILKRPRVRSAVCQCLSSTTWKSSFSC